VTAIRGGPLLVEGPVEIVLEDGTVVASDRFTVAVCACGRSGRYPFCDTSHRAACAVPEPPEQGQGGQEQGQGRD
jgi:CDGSH-type Zn-finger protein